MEWKVGFESKGLNVDHGKTSDYQWGHYKG